VTIDAANGDAAAAVRQAVTLARATLGPAWVTRPAAAPARVIVEDTSIANSEPIAVASRILAGLQRPAGATVRGACRVLREEVSVVSRQGLRTRWKATHVSADLVVSTSEHSVVLTRQARQVGDLRLGPAIAEALEDLQLISTAVPATPGPCSVVLRSDALLHGGLGVWSTLVAQSDAVVERQGLTRYREGMPIAAGAQQIAEPLTVTSDGAREHGLLSSPMGDHGDAVRRFLLVDRGIARGLGLTPREAALRGRDPNGGVRNLLVEPGTWAGTVDSSDHRVIEVKRLRSLSLDPYTGDASLEIAVALHHEGGGSKPIRGGSLRLDMITALAHARRSAVRITRGAYVGPDAVLIEQADVIA
jgi:predicted Zn-dependent protease